MENVLIERLEEELIEELDFINDSIDCEGDDKKLSELRLRKGRIFDKMQQCASTRLELEKEKDKMIIEKERNATSIDLEKEKQKITWKRVAFEMGKVLLPTALTLLYHNYASNKAYDFESKGQRITSSAGRELHLPNIFKK